MTTLKKLLLPFTAVLVLGWAGLVLAQNSPGGVFQPALDYIIGGQWTWRGTNSPWIIEGSTDDASETTITFTQPTADRTITFPNATGNAMIANAATSAMVRTGTVTLDGSNPSSATTGLSVIESCTVTAQTATAPGDRFVMFTLQTTASAGRVDVYAWTTDGSDPTLAASTVVGDVVRYVCVGTP